MGHIYQFSQDHTIPIFRIILHKFNELHLIARMENSPGAPPEMQAKKP